MKVEGRLAGRYRQAERGMDGLMMASFEETPVVESKGGGKMAVMPEKRSTRPDLYWRNSGEKSWRSSSSVSIWEEGGRAATAVLVWEVQ